MQSLHESIIFLNGYLWGPPMLVLLFGTHLYMTLKTRCIQRYLLTAIRLSFCRDRGSCGDVSQFGALSTALAATIGTGNIVGVGTAIALGGPGAVLWCWLTGVFGFATKYAEALLGVKYRVQTTDGTMLGGPMYALEKGLGMRWLGLVFCLCTVGASFGIGNMVQANSIASLMGEIFHIAPQTAGLVLACCVGVVILGGIRSIALTCEALVPFMSLFYIGGCCFILFLNAEFILPALKLIISSAFTDKAAAGGVLGNGIMMAARYGIARGLFSNEAGLGSAPIVAAAAQTKNPVRQALVSATGTFWDTVVVCALTGIVLVSCILRNPVLFQGMHGDMLVKTAFGHIPHVGQIVLSVGLLTFVFSTILGWCYYGERAVEYLLGKRAIFLYRFAWVLAVYFGSVASMPLVWDFADAMNALMALPNLVALMFLGNVVVSETATYLWSGKLEASSDEIISDRSEKCQALGMRS
ncbi:MAG: sodium:alanine symporter family protein [Desulfobacterota bacterium]|nr:sodium:alanine symporter family protein [Thermodesulfobacteriota bacterium]